MKFVNSILIERERERERGDNHNNVVVFVRECISAGQLGNAPLIRGKFRELDIFEISSKSKSDQDTQIKFFKKKDTFLCVCVCVMEMRRIPYVLPFYLIETFSPINAMNVTFNSLLKVGYKIPVLINYYLDGGF